MHSEPQNQLMQYIKPILLLPNIQIMMSNIQMLLSCWNNWDYKHDPQLLVSGSIDQSFMQPGFFKLSMSPKVAANLTCDPFWPQTLNDPPGSDFQELGLQIYTHVYHCLFMIFKKNYKTLLPCQKYELNNPKQCYYRFTSIVPKSVNYYNDCNIQNSLPPKCPRMGKELNKIYSMKTKI